MRMPVARHLPLGVASLLATMGSDLRIRLRINEVREVEANMNLPVALPPDSFGFFSSTRRPPSPKHLAMSEADTETLIAMVASLLTVPNPGQDVVLDTLVQCSGDIQAAAALIDAKHTKGSSKPASAKRQIPSSDLSNWLMSPHPTPSSSKLPSLKKKRAPQQPDTGPGPLAIKDTTHTPGNSPGKPAVDLMSVLRPPPPSKPSVPRLPPLMLSNPAMVAQHTPCTLHLSVLPPELACELFYNMMDLSQSWKRNKWWLFDRIVESPHRTSFFVRSTNGVDDNESWQEAAQYW